MTEKVLTEKQVNSRLNKYYKKVFGESDTDAFYVNPAPNMWRFERGGHTFTLVCDVITGEVTEI